MKTFKAGDRVIHKNFGEGTVVVPYEGLSSITVDFDTEGKIMTDKSMLTPLSAHASPDPKFDVRVRFTDGVGMNSGPMFQQHAEGYLTQFPDWDNVESITINRVKG